MDYNESIKVLRSLLNISQTDLAKLLGTTLVSVNRMENGHFKPAPIMMEKIDTLFKKTKKESTNWLVLITGLPASGKTTIAKKLASDFNWNYLGKDEFKIKYYEKYGFKNLQEKKELDNKSEYDLYLELIKLLENGKNVIFDKWISGNFIQLKLITEPRNISVIAIYLDCKIEVAVKRFNNRINSKTRPACLSVEEYPVKNSKSKTVYISYSDMKKKFETITSKHFGDFRMEINTDNIEHDETIYKRIKSFIIDSINLKEGKH